MLEFRIILCQGVGVEEQSLGKKAAVNKGRGPRAKSVLPTAGPPTADHQSGPSYLSLNIHQAVIHSSSGQVYSLAMYTIVLLISKNTGAWAGGNQKALFVYSLMFMKYILKLLSSENAKPERSDVQRGQEELNTRWEADPGGRKRQGRCFRPEGKASLPFVTLFHSQL